MSLASVVELGRVIGNGTAEAEDMPLEPEDLLSDSLQSIFPDDTQNLHGDPGSIITYKSLVFGNLTLAVPDPDGEAERRRFAHHLWNSSIFTALAIEMTLLSPQPHIQTPASDTVAERHHGQSGRINDRLSGILARKQWSVENHRVLELGAGLGLAGIISALAGAALTVLSDYPSPKTIENLQKNISANLTTAKAPGPVQLCGHAWGQFTDSLSLTHRHSFTRIIASDCLWMSWQHENLLKSIDHFLSLDDPDACVYLTAGFHSGRSSLALFLEAAERHGLRVHDLEEVDVDGEARSWVPVKDDTHPENFTLLKRWIFVAVLRRKRAESEVASNSK